MGFSQQRGYFFLALLLGVSTCIGGVSRSFCLSSPLSCPFSNLASQKRELNDALDRVEKIVAHKYLTDGCGDMEASLRINRNKIGIALQIVHGKIGGGLRMKSAFYLVKHLSDHQSHENILCFSVR